MMIVMNPTLLRSALCTVLVLCIVLPMKGIMERRVLEAETADEHRVKATTCGVFRLANYFQDGMVLQRGTPGAVVWGYGQPGQKVTGKVSDLAKSITAIVRADCKWNLTLPVLPAGGPYRILFSSSVADEPVKVALNDILFGDIWLCSGQSNMEFPVRKMFNGTEEMQGASQYPTIRMLRVANTFSDVTLEEPQLYMSWSLPDTKTVADFSGVCWSFGRRLAEALDIPIGLIGSHYGGTPIKAWSPPEVMKTCQQDQIGPFPNADSVLWNAMVSPLTNLSITGVIWYQGEADATANPDAYKCLFPAMITAWREHFRNEKMSFGFVQLSDLNEELPGFPLVRWHQTADYGYAPNEALPNTFMAVAMDLGDPDSPYDSIHPRYKEEVAERLSFGALSTFYGKPNITFQGPVVKRIFVEKESLVVLLDGSVTIRNSGDGNFEACCAENLALKKAGRRKDWKSCVNWTTLSIIAHLEEKIWLGGSSCGISNVAFVRYAWKTTPCLYLNCPVYGATSGLPMGPFVLPVS